VAQTEKPDLPDQPVTLWRGVRGLCPNCGKGKLFKSYLAQVERCPICGADFSGIHADDGPGWFVMVLTGAIVVPITIALALHDVIPEWAALALLVILGLGMTLLLLPRAKGVFIAILWRLRLEKSIDAGLDP
jgi:uncharacterized protein (DUF983 family)